VPRELYEAPDLYHELMGEELSAAQLVFYDRLIERHGAPVLELACWNGPPHDPDRAAGSRGHRHRLE
jgi:hypothetical protein